MTDVIQCKVLGMPKPEPIPLTRPDNRPNIPTQAAHDNHRTKRYYKQTTAQEEIIFLFQPKAHLVRALAFALRIDSHCFPSRTFT